MTFYKWSKTAASNATADASINWAEGMAPSAVNDSSRAEMAAAAKWRDDISGTLTTSGSSTAYTLTTNQVFSTAALMSGAQLTFIPHTDSGAAPTLAVDGLTARALNISTGVAVPTGYFKTGTPYRVTYIHASTEFIVNNAPAVLPANLVTTAAITDKAVTYAKIQDVSATSRLLGRLTSGSGAAEEITIGAGLVANGTTLTAPAFPAPGGFKNLVIKVATNTTVTVTADFVTTTNGTNFQTTAVSSTVNLGTSVAVDALDTGTIAIDSWYYIWVIAKSDGTTKCIASLQSTANATFLTNLSAIASGAYTYYARVGAVQTIHGSATLYGTWQFGRRAQYVVGLAQTTSRFLAASSASAAVGNMTVGASLVAVQVTGNAKAAPATASVVFGSIFGKDGSTTNIVAAPNNNFGAITSVTNPPPCVLNAAGNGTSLSVPLNFLLESNSIYWACNSMTIAAVAIDGWEDNI